MIGWRGYNGLVDVGYISIFEYRMVTMNLPEIGAATLTVLNRFGVLPSDNWQNLTVYQLTSELHLKNLNGTGKNILMNLQMNYGSSLDIINLCWSRAICKLFYLYLIWIKKYFS